jgi:hypothetical protein
LKKAWNMIGAGRCCKAFLPPCLAMSKQLAMAPAQRALARMPEQVRAARVNPWGGRMSGALVGGAGARM